MPHNTGSYNKLQHQVSLKYWAYKKGRKGEGLLNETAPVISKMQFLTGFLLLSITTLLLVEASSSSSHPADRFKEHKVLNKILKNNDNIIFKKCKYSYIFLMWV